MKGRNLTFILSLFVIFSFLAGCFSFSTDRDNIGKAIVNVNINWDDINGLGPMAEAFSDSYEISMVGARLVYPDEAAAFSQSVARTSMQIQGIITIEVPPAPKAEMYLVAIDKEKEIVLAYAFKDSLVLKSDSVLSLTHDEFQWIDAAWMIEDELADVLESGVLHFPASESHADVFIRVRDPFQESREASYETSYIGCWGTSSMLDNQDGWLGFRIVLENPNLGTPSTIEDWLQPYLIGANFNLGNKGYAIPPAINKVTINWVDPEL